MLAQIKPLKQVATLSKRERERKVACIKISAMSFARNLWGNHTCKVLEASLGTKKKQQTDAKNSVLCERERRSMK
jgi:hypothetical protein